MSGYEEEEQGWAEWEQIVREEDELREQQMSELRWEEYRKESEVQE